MTLHIGAGPTASEFKKANGTAYAQMFREAKNAAVAIDGTPQDTDPRDGFVAMSNRSGPTAEGQTLVQLWNQNENAQIRFVSGTYVEEQQGETTTGTQKDRYLEMTDVGSRGLIEVQDRLTQSVQQMNQDDSRSIFDDTQQRHIVISEDGRVAAEGYEQSELLINSGWSIAEFATRKADLGL